MIKSLFQLVFAPRRAWQELSENTFRQHFLLPLLVYPMLIVTSLSAYIQYEYGYITFTEATHNAVLTFTKYFACIISAWSLLILLARHYFYAPCSKIAIHLFVGYTYIITMLATIINNMLPSTFAFIQFAPVYSIWVVFQGKDFMQVTAENTFNFVISASALFLGLPFIWEYILNLIVK